MTLMIGKHSVVSIHYTLKDDEGEVMDSSEGREPLAYLHGENNLIPGLESELQGKTAGSRFATVIEPKDAYGEVNDDFIQTLNKQMFQGVEDIQPGMTFIAQGEGGQQRQVRVMEIEGENVTIDANHPMAGKTLHFDVEVVDVREATPQEIEHGHVHFPRTRSLAYDCIQISPALFLHDPSAGRPSAWHRSDLSFRTAGLSSIFWPCPRNRPNRIHPGRWRFSWAAGRAMRPSQ